MGAGISTTTRNSRIRYALQKVARENDGVYKMYTAKGIKQGTYWFVKYKTLYASNGESCMWQQFFVDGVHIDGAKNVDEAITQYKQNELAKLAESDIINP
jgi:hypothetical protein